MNESKRQQKVAKLLLKDLGEIFQRDTRGILSGAFVTISDVQITPDLSIAFIYISMMLVKNRQELIDRINDRKSEIRRELGNKIGKQVRIIPDLKFYIDTIEEDATRIDSIIDELNIPPAKDDTDNTK
jgi:ribosome-binding factor A